MPTAARTGQTKGRVSISVSPGGRGPGTCIPPHTNTCFPGSLDVGRSPHLLLGRPLPRQWTRTLAGFQWTSAGSLCGGSVLRDGHQRLTHPPHYSTSHPTSCRTSPLTPFFPPPETGEPVGEALGGPALGSSSVELRDLWNQLSVDRDASRLLPTSVNCTTVQVHTWVHLLGLSQE